MKLVLIAFAVLVFTSFKCEAARSKRQFSPFSRYICGVAPFRFSSDIPCNYYAICPNGGFMMNIGCRNNDTCHLYRVDSICMGDCCCTVPKIENGTTTIRPSGLQRDAPSNSTKNSSSQSYQSNSISLIIFLIILVYRP